MTEAAVDLHLFLTTQNHPISAAAFSNVFISGSVLVVLLVFVVVDDDAGVAVTGIGIAE